jgi:hypothetical protein
MRAIPLCLAIVTATGAACSHGWDADDYGLGDILADYFDKDGKPVVRQRASKIEVRRQPWRSVPRGSLEEMAAEAGCRYFGHRAAASISAGTSLSAR